MADMNNQVVKIVVGRKRGERWVEVANSGEKSIAGELVE